MDDRDYRERLAHDAASWSREGLISAEQERAILARAGAGTPSLVAAFRMGWLISAVSIIGALLLGAGVLLVFAANWEQMPDALRTILLLGSMCAAYGIGFALTHRYGLDRIGGALILLGALLFEAGLFLLAQIYNMPVESPQLLLMAAGGIAPVAYAFGSRIILLLAIGNFVSWAIWEIEERYDGYGKDEAAYIAIGALGVALVAVGRLHLIKAALAHFGDLFVLSGVLVVLVLLYGYSFTYVWDSLIRDDVTSYAAPVSIYIALALAAAVTALAWALRERDLENTIEAGGLLGLLAVGAVVATWPAWTGYAVVFSALYFVVTGAIVARGYLRGDERYINAGLILVAIGILSRYCDLFWSMLASSAFFIVGGVLLLGLAFALEWLRRSLLRAIEDDPPGSRPSTLSSPEALS